MQNSASRLPHVGDLSSAHQPSPGRAGTENGLAPNLLESTPFQLVLLCSLTNRIHILMTDVYRRN